MSTRLHITIVAIVLLVASAYLAYTDDPRCTGRPQPGFCAN